MRGKRGIGIGYITCPSNIEYTKYIETCYKTKTVSIVTEDSEVYHQVKISVNLFPNIRFPEPSKKEIIGSIVIFVRPQGNSIPTIISILELDDSGSDLLPSQWRLSIHTKNSNTSLIQGDTKEGTLDIVTHNLKKGSEINIRATSKVKDSIIRLESDGEVQVLADKLIKVNSGTKIQLGEDDQIEAAVLGDSWKELMENLIDSIKDIKVTLPTGILNVATGTVSFTLPGTISLSSSQKLEQIKPSLVDTLSELVFLQ